MHIFDFLASKTDLHLVEYIHHCRAYLSSDYLVIGHKALFFVKIVGQFTHVLLATGCRTAVKTPTPQRGVVTNGRSCSR